MSKKHNLLKKNLISITGVIGCTVNCLAAEPPRKAIPNMPIYQQYVQENMNVERRMPSQMRTHMEKITHEQTLIEIKLQEQALEAYLNIGEPIDPSKLQALTAYQQNGMPVSSMANVTSNSANFVDIF